MQSIVDTKGCIVPGLSNSSKRYDSKCKKLSNQTGKRTRSTKAFVEQRIYNNAIEYPELIIKDTLTKYETKKDLKEDVKDERKCDLNLNDHLRNST